MLCSCRYPKGSGTDKTGVSEISGKYPQYKPEVLETMEEAKAISRNPETKSYGSFAEALEDMDL